MIISFNLKNILLQQGNSRIRISEKNIYLLKEVISSRSHY